MLIKRRRPTRSPNEFTESLHHLHVRRRIRPREVQHRGRFWCHPGMHTKHISAMIHPGVCPRILTSYCTHRAFPPLFSHARRATISHSLCAPPTPEEAAQQERRIAIAHCPRVSSCRATDILYSLLQVFLVQGRQALERVFMFFEEVCVFGLRFLFHARPHFLGLGNK